MERIFIFLNSFDDTEVKTTVDDALDKAEYPERIDFGIYEQRSDDKFEDFSDPKYSNVIHVKAKCETIMGVGIARVNAIMMHTYQEYTLSVDAHTLFEGKWDTNIIHEFKKLKQICKKPIISQRVPHWYRDADGSIVKVNKDDVGYSSILKSKVVEIDLRPGEEEFLLRPGKSYLTTILEDIQPKKNYPQQHYMICGAFIFANTKFFIDCMWNLDIGFYGEEQLMALRAWTNGYKIFVIEKNYFWSKGKKQELDSDTGEVIKLGEIVQIDTSDEDAGWRVLNKSRNIDKRFTYSPIIFNMELNFNHSFATQILKGKYIGYWGAKSRRMYRKYMRRLGTSYRKYHTPMENKDFERRIKSYES